MAGRSKGSHKRRMLAMLTYSLCTLAQARAGFTTTAAFLRRDSFPGGPSLGQESTLASVVHSRGRKQDIRGGATVSLKVVLSQVAGRRSQCSVSPYTDPPLKRRMCVSKHCGG